MVRILEHELEFLEGTIEDYWRRVSRGLNRGYFDSLTHLVLAGERANAKPFVYVKNNEMILLYATPTDVYIRYIAADDLAKFCFIQLKGNPDITYHFNFLPTEVAETLEQMLRDDFRERAVAEFHKQRENAGIPEKAIRVLETFLDLHDALTIKGGMLGMAQYLSGKGVLNPESLQQLQELSQKFRTSKLVHIYHDLTEFDPELESAEYAKLRNAVSRAKRANIVIERYDASQLAAFNELVDRWNAKKRRDFEEWKKEQQDQGKKVDREYEPVTYTKKIASNLRYSPETEIYVARVEGSNNIVAAAGIGVFGESAYMDFRHQDFTVKGATEYLEYAVMCQLKARGVKTLSRGRVFVENVEDDNLYVYKAKFDPLEQEGRTNYTVTRLSDEKVVDWISQYFFKTLVDASQHENDTNDHDVAQLVTRLVGALDGTTTTAASEIPKKEEVRK